MAIDIRHELKRNEFHSGPFIDFSGKVRAYESDFDLTRIMTTIVATKYSTETRIFRREMSVIYICSFDTDTDYSHFRYLQSDFTFKYFRHYIVGDQS